MLKNIKKFNLKWVLIVFFWVTCAYLVILSGVFVYFSYKEIANTKAHDALLLKLKNVEDLAYVRNTRDNYGGETPAGTIYMYYEFLESQQYRLSSTMFTKETRDAHFAKLENISEPAMRKFVEVLRLLEKEATGVSVAGSRFELDAPIKIVFKKVPGYAGTSVWQMESIDYPLP